MKPNNRQFHLSKPASALHKLYARQQPKLKITDRTTSLLKVFASDDQQAVANLISVWLSEPKKNTSS